MAITKVAAFIQGPPEAMKNGFASTPEADLVSALMYLRGQVQQPLPYVYLTRLYLPFFLVHALPGRSLIISGVGLAFIIFVSIWGASNIEKAPAFTLVLYAGLIVVTMLYAYCTMEIAGATRKQADASVEMAKNIREQTKTLKDTISMSVRPSISIDITRTSGGNTYPFEPPSEFGFQLQNGGKGTAKNLLITGEGQDKKVEYSEIELPSLNVGDKKDFSIHRTTDVSTNKVRVAYVTLKAIYNDELGEDWFVTQEVYKDSKSGSWKAGDTTPGQRIGEEHD